LDAAGRQVKLLKSRSRGQESGVRGRQLVVGGLPALGLRPVLLGYDDVVRGRPTERNTNYLLLTPDY